MSGRTLFAQTMDHLPWTTFGRIVTLYKGDHRVRTMRCSEQYRIMAFAQMTYRESLRDIEACLAAQSNRLYQNGFRAPVRRTTLADANERRDWRADFAQRLIAQARRLYSRDNNPIPDLAETVYALDSTTIDLCLSIFPWADFRATKAAVKMHTLLARHDPSFHPCFRRQATRRQCTRRFQSQEQSTLWTVPMWTSSGFSIIVAHFSSPGRKKSSRCTASTQIPETAPKAFVHLVKLDGVHTSRAYLLRRIRFHDAETGSKLTFLTKLLDAPTICALYKSRWHVELFFKWMKQHLRIKRFFGRSENAVKTQIWIAVSVYVLIAIMRKRLEIDTNLYTILQILSVMPFEKIELKQALSLGADSSGHYRSDNQLNLFDN